MNFPTEHASLRPRQVSAWEQLPLAIRQYYSEREYLFLTDQQKNELLLTETEPDPE